MDLKKVFGKIPGVTDYRTREDKLTHEFLLICGKGTYSIPEVLAASASVIAHVLSSVPSLEAKRELLTNVHNGLREVVLGEKAAAGGPLTILKQ